MAPLLRRSNRTGRGDRPAHALAGRPAAAGLAAEMAGATIINAAVLHSGTGVLTLVLCALSAFLAYRRRQQIKDLPAVMRRCLTMATRTGTDVTDGGTTR